MQRLRVIFFLTNFKQKLPHEMVVAVLTGGKNKDEKSLIDHLCQDVPAVFDAEELIADVRTQILQDRGFDHKLLNLSRLAFQYFVGQVFKEQIQGIRFGIQHFLQFRAVGQPLTQEIQSDYPALGLSLHPFRIFPRNAEAVLLSKERGYFFAVEHQIPLIIDLDHLLEAPGGPLPEA